MPHHSFVSKLLHECHTLFFNFQLAMGCHGMVGKRAPRKPRPLACLQPNTQKGWNGKKGKRKIYLLLLFTLSYRIGKRKIYLLLLFTLSYRRCGAEEYSAVGPKHLRDCCWQLSCIIYIITTSTTPTTKKEEEELLFYYHYSSPLLCISNYK